MKVIEISEKPYQCPHCAVRFRLKKNIPRHIKEQHNSQPKLQCVYCDKTFVNIGNYKIHYGRAHKNDFLLYSEPQEVMSKYLITYWCNANNKLINSNDCSSSRSG